MTVIDWVVAPFDQRFPVELLEVRVTLPPGQNESGPLAVITGVGTDERVETATGDDVAEQFPEATVTK